MKLLIGMLSYNRIDFTRRAIESLYKNTNIDDFDLIILDKDDDFANFIEKSGELLHVS